MYWDEWLGLTWTTIKRFWYIQQTVKTETISFISNVRELISPKRLRSFTFTTSPSNTMEARILTCHHGSTQTFFRSILHLTHFFLKKCSALLCYLNNCKNIFLSILEVKLTFMTVCTSADWSVWNVNQILLPKCFFLWRHFLSLPTHCPGSSGREQSVAHKKYWVNTSQMNKLLLIGWISQ